MIEMISQINIGEFRKRLDLNTKYGNPKISGTPFHTFNMFGDKNKKFYGKFGQNDFQLTRNAVLHPIPFIISGKIHSNNANQTEIIYEIIPIKFGYYWIRYFPFIAFIIFNFIFCIQSPPIIIIILFNLFIAIGGIISNAMINRRRNDLEKKFREIFEIVD